MDEFGYLSVLLSIILGLAVTQILVGIRGRMLTRAHVREYWPVQVWAFFFLLVSAQTWWAMFALRNRHDWSFSAFAILLAQVIVLYLITGLLYPDFGHERRVDLRAHYFQQRRHFFSLAILLVAVSVCRDLIFNQAFPHPTNLAFQISFMALAASGVLWATEWYHKLCAIIVPGIFIAYIVVLFTRLR